MKQNNVGEMIFNEQDVCDLLMSGRKPGSIKGMLVDSSVNIEQAIQFVDTYPELIQYAGRDDVMTNVFDKEHQARWHMPEEYKQLDIAEYVLGLCSTEAELQRVGHELLLFQERDLFNLLRYLKYLVDLMTANNVIWGVGRGSSVASYVLYKLGVHRIDSMFYKLEPEEFLR
jgi:DNA polymerase III alpha subunit